MTMLSVSERIGRQSASDPKRIDNDDARENVFWKAWQEMQSLIAATPATSPAGVAVKLRQILAEEASDAADEAALESALADLERM
jgi:hypothetical protein